MAYKDSRGYDAHKTSHEARKKAKYHEKKEGKRLGGPVTSLIDTRQKAYLQVDRQSLRIKVVKLQEDCGYDSLTEDEKYTLIEKAMLARASGLEDRTIPLKFEELNGVNCQKMF